jgi:hypothetical protein
LGRGQRLAAAAAVLAVLAGVGCGVAGSLSPQAKVSGSGSMLGSGSRSGSTSGPVSWSGQGGMVTPGTGSAPGASNGQPMGAASRSGVLDGALFGGDQPLVPETGRLGRNLAIVRMYFEIGEQFPIPSATAVMRQGSTLLVSLDTGFSKGQGSYESVISGQHDAYIRQFLENMQQAAVTYRLGAIYFCFEHEANAPDHTPVGSPAQFVQAWDHVHALAASAHVLWNDGGRVHFVMILTNMAYDSMTARPAWADSAGAASSYFPGKNEVDIIGVDGYNTGGCRQVSTQVAFMSGGAATTSPAALFGPAISFARAQGNLPVFVAEWGSVAFAGNSKQATFISQMQAYVTANHEIAAALYWNSYNGQHPGCLMSLDNQPESMATLAVMGHSAPLQGRVVPPPASN